MGEPSTEDAHRPHPELARPLPCGPGALTLQLLSNKAALTLTVGPAEKPCPLQRDPPHPPLTPLTPLTETALLCCDHCDFYEFSWPFPRGSSEDGSVNIAGYPTSFFPRCRLLDYRGCGVAGCGRSRRGRGKRSPGPRTPAHPSEPVKCALRAGAAPFRSLSLLLLPSAALRTWLLLFRSLPHKHVWSPTRVTIQ
ncbi:hypothetical protein NDU88_004006 [Pleurodeles waltl]|uniref:Uncharacterized protein n=1 Tax=Pleurodeles waltl TaxID=8319 RepID=A0AAV7VEY0_PLEWA|nr:hypothetical protein NDU88_004006 [Pleurodeles waltl]